MARTFRIPRVSDDLHRKLEERAAHAGLTLTDYLLEAVRRIAEVPTPAEMRSRLALRSSVRFSRSVVDLVRAERDAS